MFYREYRGQCFVILNNMASLFRSAHKKITLFSYTFQGILLHFILLLNRIKKFQAFSQNVTVKIAILFLSKRKYFSLTFWTLFFR